MLKRMAITSLAAAAFLSTATVVTAPFTPAEAQVSITFGAPPPPRYEVVPAPRAGYVWAPGHYELVRDQYVWVPGQWLTQRAGYRYVPSTWERYYSAGREQWRYVPSRWDRDGDGVPDRYEAKRYHNSKNNGAFGDRDHDGIPNAFDNWDNRRR
jgi:hypothetical protein